MAQWLKMARKSAANQARSKRMLWPAATRMALIVDFRCELTRDFHREVTRAVGVYVPPVSVLVKSCDVSFFCLPLAAEALN